MEISDEKTFLVAFGQHLQKVRLDKGLTQAQLANDLGVEISQISRIERGVINTSIGNINAIAKILKVPVSELFEFD